MNSRIIATLAILGTVFMSSFGTAHAGVLFEVVKSVGKEIVHKAVADKQERERRAYYQQQRAQQRRAQQQRAPKQPAGQAVQALPAATATGATTNPTAGSEL